MSKALSLDLRVRVLAAVQAGATHRQAGERFDDLSNHLPGNVQVPGRSPWSPSFAKIGPPYPGVWSRNELVRIDFED